jgi:hypothetical protein
MRQQQYGGAGLLMRMTVTVPITLVLFHLLRASPMLMAVMLLINGAVPMSKTLMVATLMAGTSLILALKVMNHQL